MLNQEDVLVKYRSQCNAKNPQIGVNTSGDLLKGMSEAISL